MWFGNIILVLTWLLVVALLILFIWYLWENTGLAGHIKKMMYLNGYDLPKI